MTKEAKVKKLVGKEKKPRVSKSSKLLLERAGVEAPQKAEEGLSWSRDMHEILQQTQTPAPKKSPPKKKRDEIFEYLKEHLSIEVMNGGFTDPNNRNIRIFLKGELITEANFDVVQKREYEG